MDLKAQRARRNDTVDLQAVHLLGESDDLIRLLRESTGEGVYGADLNRDCTFANPACVSILGFESDTELLGTLDELQDATVTLTRCGIDGQAWAAVVGWDREIRQRASVPLSLSPTEASDREEELLRWLEAHGVDEGWFLASTLVSARLSTTDLEAIAETLPEGTVETVSRVRLPLG